MKDIDQQAMLQEIKCPAIYLKAAVNYGKDGVLYAANSDEDAQKVRQSISGCEMTTIESDHDIHYEHPYVLISACENLLKMAQ